MKLIIKLSTREAEAVKDLFGTLGFSDVLAEQSEIDGPVSIENIAWMDGSFSGNITYEEGFIVKFFRVLTKHAPMIKCIGATVKSLYESLKFTLNGLEEDLKELVKEENRKAA